MAWMSQAGGIAFSGHFSWLDGTARLLQQMVIAPNARLFANAPPNHLLSFPGRGKALTSHAITTAT